MDKLSIDRCGSVRPEMDHEAPWSSRTYRSRSNSETRAVVYAIGPENGETCKVGQTRSVKRRLYDLSFTNKMALHVHFWVEVPAAAARLVEASAISLLRRKTGVTQGEWFPVTAEDVAFAILAALKECDVKARHMAGFPGAIDPERSEIEEVLAEPHYMEDANRKGRADRELWCPHSRSISY